MIAGEAFYEDVTFEGLQTEDSVDLGDCVVDNERKVCWFLLTILILKILYLIIIYLCFYILRSILL